MKLPSFENYGRYSSANYGANTLVFSVGEANIYFSYKTPVAFSTPSTGLVVRENNWGPTTGKHLNWIDGGCKRGRIHGDEFEHRLEEVMA